MAITSVINRTGGWGAPKIDIKSPVLYLPLWRPSPDKFGATIYSDDPTSHSCTVSGTTWGYQGRIFDGTDDQLLFGDNAAFELNTFTIMGWVKRAVAGAEHIVLSMQYQATGADGVCGVTLGFQADNTLLLATCISNAFVNTATTATYSSTSDFYFVVATKSGTAVELLVDGASAKTATLSSATVDYTTSGAKRTAIGGRWRNATLDYAGDFNGTISTVIVYNRLSNLSEILRTYQTTRGRHF